MVILTYVTFPTRGTITEINSATPEDRYFIEYKKWDITFLHVADFFFEDIRGSN